MLTLSFLFDNYGLYPNDLVENSFIIDDELYSIGSSIKDIGKRISQISRLESINIDELLNRY